MDLLVKAKNIITAAKRQPLIGKINLQRRAVLHRDLKLGNGLVVPIQDRPCTVKQLAIGLSIVFDITSESKSFVF